MEDEMMANSQPKRVEISIEEALVSFQQVPFEQLVAKKEEMFFKVCTVTKLIHSNMCVA